MEKSINPELPELTANLTFVTGNPTKFAEAQKIAAKYGIVLQNRTLEIVEIQSSNPTLVVRAKAKSAYEMLGRPVVVHDASWSIPSLNGFPGAYMHDMVKWFKPEDWLNLMQRHSDRVIEVCENVTYYDGQTMKSFQYHQCGFIVDSPRGVNGNSLEKVVVLADDKTIAEHHDLGMTNNSVDLKAWEELFQWYRMQDNILK